MVDINKLYTGDTKAPLDKDVLAAMIREKIDEKCETKIKEKYKKKKKESADDDHSDDEHSDDHSDEGDDESETDASVIKESIDVHATKVGRGNDTVTMNIARIRDLVPLARSRKYEKFVVVDRSGKEQTYFVDPQGNLVER